MNCCSPAIQNSEKYIVGVAFLCELQKHHNTTFLFSILEVSLDFEVLAIHKNS
jgi:hypothetical protein